MTNIELKKRGREDFMGHSWYGVYKNGKKVMIQGVHYSIKAVDKKTAESIFNNDEVS